MLLAPAGQATFQQSSIPVSPKRQSPVGVLARQFIPPAGLVSQTSSQPVTGASDMTVSQLTRPVNQSATLVAVDT